MTHDWKLVESTRFDGCSEKEQNTTYHEVRKCSNCGEELTTYYTPFISTCFVGGGECTGAYPIKVRVV
jgi:hypothetical protein